MGSPSAAQTAAFFEEARNGRAVFGVKDDQGFPSPKNGEASRAMPFWSKLSRVERIISSAPAYKDMEPVEIKLDDFIDRWLPGLQEDGILVGLNWSGTRATGYDLKPSEVLARLASTGSP